MARFWAKVNKDGPTVRPELGRCWEWTAARHEDGYGLMHVGSRTDRTRRMVRASRVSWEIQAGSAVPLGLFVLHRCDNPPCVNPGHLWLGTNQDNVDDREAKGRGRLNAAFRQAVVL